MNSGKINVRDMNPDVINSGKMNFEDKNFKFGEYVCVLSRILPIDIARKIVSIAKEENERERADLFFTKYAEKVRKEINLYWEKFEREKQKIRSHYENLYGDEEYIYNSDIEDYVERSSYIEYMVKKPPVNIG